MTVFKRRDVDREGTDNNRSWFKRSSHKIFKSKVSNVKQTSYSRKMMLAWRSLNTDRRGSSTRTESSEKKSETLNSGVQSEKEYQENDVKLALEMLRRKH